jgi:hypothetical protein
MMQKLAVPFLVASAWVCSGVEARAAPVDDLFRGGVKGDRVRDPVAKWVLLVPEVEGDYFFEPNRLIELQPKRAATIEIVVAAKALVSAAEPDPKSGRQHENLIQISSFDAGWL